MLAAANPGARFRDRRIVADGQPRSPREEARRTVAEALAEIYIHVLITLSSARPHRGSSACSSAVIFGECVPSRLPTGRLQRNSEFRLNFVKLVESHIGTT